MDSLISGVSISSGVLEDSDTTPATVPILTWYRERGDRSVMEALVWVESQILKTTSPAAWYPLSSMAEKYTLYWRLSGTGFGGSHRTTMEETLSMVADSAMTLVGGGGGAETVHILVSLTVT